MGSRHGRSSVQRYVLKHAKNSCDLMIPCCTTSPHHDSRSRPRLLSNHNPFNFIQRYLIGPPIIETRRAGTFMIGHLLRDFQLAPVPQIFRNARGAKGVVADLRPNADGRRALANHAVGVRLRHGLIREQPRSASHRPKEWALALRELRHLDIGVEVLIKIVMAGHRMEFSTFLVQPHPGPSPLDIHIFHRHRERRADPGKRIDHQPDQGPIAQAHERLHIDRIEEHPRFLRREHRRLAFLRGILWPTDRARRIRWDDLADHEPIEEHPDRGEMLFHRGGRHPALQGFDISGHMHRLNGL